MGSIYILRVNREQLKTQKKVVFKEYLNKAQWCHFTLPGAEHKPSCGNGGALRGEAQGSREARWPQTPGGGPPAGLPMLSGTRLGWSSAPLPTGASLRPVAAKA